MKTLSSSLLLCSVLAAPAALAAETQKLDPVFVTATRSDQPQNRLPAAATVITREDIAASGVRNVADALRLAPGVQVRDFFGDGSQYTGIDMRGFGAAANANTLILVDGRRLNNPDIAGPDLSSISLKDVERIEIINGSAGTLYGDQAVGGVINIITRQSAAFAGQIEAGGGSYGEMHGSAAVSQRVGGFFYRVSGESRGSDNYRDNNHHENHNVTGRAGYDYGSGSAYLETGYVKDRYQLAGALTAAEVDQNRRQCQPGACGNFLDSTTAFQRLNWEQTLSSRWSIETDVTHRRGNGSGFLGFALTQDRNQWSINPRVSGKLPLPAGEGLLTTGIDLQRSSYEIVGFGPQSDTQRLRDLYVQAVLPVAAAWEVTVGARNARVDNELVDSFGAGTPVDLRDTRNAWEAGVAWKATQHLRLYTRYDGNFRFAKADEYFSLFPPVTTGNSPLQTQTGRTYEVGGDWKGQSLDLHASLYQLDLNNEISFNPGTFSNFNLDETRRRGVLLQAGWQAMEKLKLSAGAQYLDAKFSNGPFSGNRVPLVAQKTGRLAANVKLPQNLDSMVELQATGRRPFDSDFASASAPLPGFVVANLALNGEWGAWRASARVNNLLDHEYSEYGVIAFGGTPTFYPSPERNYSLNLGYSF